MGDVGSVAELLTKIFGFVVDSDGFQAMKREHQLEVIHSGIKIGLDKREYSTVDALFERYRELLKASD